MAEAGQFDHGQAEGITHVVDRADMHYLFYCGSPGAQKTPNNEYAVGLARVRRHRFVSQMAGDEGGYLLTRLVRVTHPNLRVNLTLPTTVGARTDFQAELLAPDERGVAHPVPGYTFDDCVTTAIDGLDVPVRWRDQADLAPLLNKPIMIRFFLRNAGLYTFQFTPT